MACAGSAPVQPTVCWTKSEQGKVPDLGRESLNASFYARYERGLPGAHTFAAQAPEVGFDVCWIGLEVVKSPLLPTSTFCSSMFGPR